jgi:arginine utilization regulatory protein
VRDMFFTYSWPGNVRELQHVIEGAMNLAGHGFISRNDLPNGFKEYFKNDTRQRGKSQSLKDMMEQVEREMIYAALEESGMNVTKAAQALDIPRQTLQYKMAKYRIK